MVDLYLYVLSNAWYVSFSDFSFYRSNGGLFQDGRDLIEKNLFKHLHKTISRNKRIKMSTKVLLGIRNVSDL